MITATIEHDVDCESPLEFSSWRLVSFNRNDSNAEYAGKYLATWPKSHDEVPEPVDKALAKRIETGTAFWLGWYSHSGTVWSLHGEGNRCQWDSVAVGGILLWEGKAKEIGKNFEERQDAARRAVSAYTDWINGNYFWACVEQDGIAIESCGGLLGVDGVEDFVREIIGRVGKPSEAIEYDGEAAGLMTEWRPSGRYGPTHV